VKTEFRRMRRMNATCGMIFVLVNAAKIIVTAILIMAIPYGRANGLRRPYKRFFEQTGLFVGAP
jgi:hypothetical protein